MTAQKLSIQLRLRQLNKYKPPMTILGLTMTFLINAAQKFRICNFCSWHDFFNHRNL